MQYYLVIHGKRMGPLTLEQLEAAGLERETLVWHEGAEGWLAASQVPELRDLISKLPPPLPPPPVQASRSDTERRPPDWSLNPVLRRSAASTFRQLYWWFLATFIAIMVLGAMTLLFLMLHDATRVWQANGPGRRNPVWEVAAVLCMILSIPVLAAHIVLFFVQIYKMWALIQDDHAETTPQAAVGLCFVPIFNLYWIFIAIYGLARNLNAFCRRHEIPARPAPLGLALMTCVVAVIPYVNLFTWVPLLIAFWLLKNTAGDIADYLRHLPPPRPDDFRHETLAPPEWPRRQDASTSVRAD